MTRDEIIKLAREAGGGLSCIAEPLEHPWKFSQAEIERFSALVAAAEREMCAKVCDEKADQIIDTNRMVSAYVFAGECAAAIRARGEKGGAE